jgi:hypothetical protein
MVRRNRALRSDATPTSFTVFHTGPVFYNPHEKRKKKKKGKREEKPSWQPVRATVAPWHQAYLAISGSGFFG